MDKTARSACLRHHSAALSFSFHHCRPPHMGRIQIQAHLYNFLKRVRRGAQPQGSTSHNNYKSVDAMPICCVNLNPPPMDNRTSQLHRYYWVVNPPHTYVRTRIRIGKIRCSSSHHPSVVHIQFYFLLSSFGMYPSKQGPQG